MNTTFRRVAPTIHVRDLSRALAYWIGQLGFEVRFTNGEPISFAVVGRDSAEVHLKVEPDIAGTCHCHILVEGIEPLFDALKSNGAMIKQPLRNQIWGLRDIVLVDPDGNTMEIAEPIAQRTSA